jgi:uncharacterized RmlC-like cupin family protein
LARPGGRRSGADRFAAAKLFRSGLEICRAHAVTASACAYGIARHHDGSSHVICALTGVGMALPADELLADPLAIELSL